MIAEVFFFIASHSSQDIKKKSQYLFKMCYE